MEIFQLSYDVMWNGVFSCPAGFLCDVTLSLHTSAAKSTRLMIIRSPSMFIFNPKLVASSAESRANIFNDTVGTCLLNRICLT